MLSHSVNSFLVVRTSFHFRKVPSVTQNTDSLFQSIRSLPELAQGKLSRFSHNSSPLKRHILYYNFSTTLGQQLLIISFFFSLKNRILFCFDGRFRHKSGHFFRLIGTFLASARVRNQSNNKNGPELLINTTAADTAVIPYQPY